MAKKKPKKLDNIAALVPDPENANKGDERGQGVIAKSLEKFGAGRSIVTDRNGVVLCGNKTLEAFTGNGGERIRVVETDGHELVVVQRTDLDLNGDNKARALALADNRAGELSYDPDHALIAQQAVDLGIDVGDIGFGEDELAKLAGIDAETESSGGGGENKQMTCPHCGAVFTPGDK